MLALVQLGRGTSQKPFTFVKMAGFTLGLAYPFGKLPPFLNDSTWRIPKQGNLGCPPQLRFVHNFTSVRIEIISAKVCINYVEDSFTNVRLSSGGIFWRSGNKRTIEAQKNIFKKQTKTPKNQLCFLHICSSKGKDWSLETIIQSRIFWGCVGGLEIDTVIIWTYLDGKV